MHHHGKGVYSGTFSGTLNPALQDRHGRPKRDISTIIHILNDLLCATPANVSGHYSHRRSSSGRGQSSSASTSADASSPSTSTNGGAEKGKKNSISHYVKKINNEICFINNFSLQTNFPRRTKRRRAKCVNCVW